VTVEKNTGSLLFIPTGIKVDKLDPIDHETFTIIDKVVVSKIVTAHNIPAILLEASISGGFNNRAQEMEAAINQFQQTTILAYQQKITRIFKKILSYVTPKEFELRIIPFSLSQIETKAQGDANINS